MATSTKSSIDVSPATLNDIPRRAFAFLNTLGTQISVRATLNDHGYTEEDHTEGWRLLHQASGSSSVTAATNVAPAAAAIRELDGSDEVIFHKAHAALTRKFPEQADFVFADLAPSAGPTAVLGVVKFLDRLDVLEKGDARPETKDVDKAAIDTLTARGVGPDERARLRKLTELAQSSPIIPSLTSAKTAEAEAAHMNDLKELYAWYAQWTEVARAVVTRRADLILLGMARRKRTGTSSDTDTDETGTPDAQDHETSEEDASRVA